MTTHVLINNTGFTTITSAHIKILPNLLSPQVMVNWYTAPGTTPARNTKKINKFDQILVQYTNLDHTAADISKQQSKYSLKVIYESKMEQKSRN